MIYDCFMFNDELDQLEIRLNHNDFVDRFVLVESTKTYNGKIKPLYYQENKARFHQFGDRIYHIINDFPFNTNIDWTYEHLQRNILKGLTCFTKNDWLIYSDCDELIDKRVLSQINDSSKIWHLQMDLFFYYFNVKLKDARNNDSYHLNKSFKSKFHLAKIIRPEILFKFRNLYEIRQFEIEEPNPKILIKNAGWHFSNLGSPERVWNKLTAFSHWGEPIFNGITLEVLRKNMKDLQDPLSRNIELEIIHDDSNLPEYIRINKEKFRKYFYE